MKSISVNGKMVTVDVTEDMPLLWFLRDTLKLKGTKYGCGIGQCGACTVHVDGKAERSCQIKLATIGEQKIVTIEGISERGMHAVQQAWIDLQVPQCGYCQSGQIMSAIALLSVDGKSSEENRLRKMEVNLCRCGTYDRIRKAIQRAVLLIEGDRS